MELSYYQPDYFSNRLVSTNPPLEELLCSHYLRSSKPLAFVFFLCNDVERYKKSMEEEIERHRNRRLMDSAVDRDVWLNSHTWRSSNVTWSCFLFTSDLHFKETQSCHLESESIFTQPLQLFSSGCLR